MWPLAGVCACSHYPYVPESCSIRTRGAAHMRAVDFNRTRPGGRLIVPSCPQLPSFDNQCNNSIDHDGQRVRAVKDTERFFAVCAPPLLAARVAACVTNNRRPCNRENTYVTGEQRIQHVHHRCLVVPEPAQPPLTCHQSLFPCLTVSHGEVVD